MFWSVALGLAIGVGCGLLNGVLVAYLGVLAFIATLGMAQVFTSLASHRVDGKPVFGLVEHNFVDIARGDLLGVSNKIWISMTFAGAVWLLLDRTTLGRQMYAVGGNAQAAYLSGINARRIRLVAFATAGFAAAAAGILQAATTATANTSAPQPWMLQSIAGVFLGMAMFRSGRPNLPGTVLGVILLRTLDNGLNFTDLNDYLQNAISGAAIVIAVLPPALARLRASSMNMRSIHHTRERATMKRHSSRAAAAILATTLRGRRLRRHRRAPDPATVPSVRRAGGNGRRRRRRPCTARRRRLRLRRRTGRQRAGRHRRVAAEALEIAVLTPDYAAQPAAKEAIDLFEAAAEAHGHTVTVVDTNSDNAAMNAEITTAVSQGVDAIVVAFGTPQEFGDGLADAAEAGIPVFGLDTGGVVEGILVNVTTDNRFLGEQSAQAIIDAIGEGGTVAMIHFDPFEPVRLRAEAAQGAVRGERHRDHRVRPGRPEDSTGFASAAVGDLLAKYPGGRARRDLGRVGRVGARRLSGDRRRRPHRGPRHRRRRPGVRHRRGGQGRQLDRHRAPGLADDLGDRARPDRGQLRRRGTGGGDRLHAGGPDHRRERLPLTGHVGRRR